MLARMIASVHLADIGRRGALASALRTPRPDRVPGLRHANVALAGSLGGSVVPSPDFGRMGLVAFWDDDEALDRFLSDHPLAAKLAGGWSVRLAPRRASGTWPGLSADVPADAPLEDDPAAVLTLGRLRLTQTVRFLRTSARAEAAVLDAEGLIWATGLARPPFVCTFSLWRSSRDLATYAYGREQPAHAAAIAAHAAKSFHHESAFIRFRPLASAGSLRGRNPLGEHWTSSTPD
jgi:hypothetical protein